MPEDIERERHRLEAAVSAAEVNLAAFTASAPISGVDEPADYPERLIMEARLQLDQAMSALADFNRRGPN